MSYQEVQNKSNSSQVVDYAFENYVVTTTDPGASLMCFTIFFCMFCTLFVPIFFVLRDRQTKEIKDEIHLSPMNSSITGMELKRKSFERKGMNDLVLKDILIPTTNSPSEFETKKDVDTRVNLQLQETIQSSPCTTSTTNSHSQMNDKILPVHSSTSILKTNGFSEEDTSIKRKKLNRSWRNLFINKIVTKLEFKPECPERCLECASSLNHNGGTITIDDCDRDSIEKDITNDGGSNKSGNSGVLNLLENLLGIFDVGEDTDQDIWQNSSSFGDIDNIISSDDNNRMSNSKHGSNNDDSISSFGLANIFYGTDGDEEKSMSENYPSNNSEHSSLYDKLTQAVSNQDGKELKSQTSAIIAKDSNSRHVLLDMRNMETELYPKFGDKRGRIMNDNKLSQNSPSCPGKKACWNRHSMKHLWVNLRKIIRYDRESKEIMKLALPFALGEVIDAIFEMIDIALISHFMGSKALSACIISETLISLTDEFIGGIIDALGTIIPQSVGTGNNYLTGQYLQITIGLYLICSIPFVGFWWYWMYDAILWFGFDEEVAELGWEYTTVALVTMIINGVGEAFETFLEVNGFQFYILIFSIIGGITEISMFILILYKIEDLTLVDAAYVDLFFTAFLGILMIIIPIGKGWINEYLDGIFCNIAFKNGKAVKNLSKTAAPLSVGTVLAYGEWELLTVFAAHMGPAEVAAWGILGAIWETFEASTEALGDSAEVRVGQHLGKGNIEMAKTSAHKSLLWGTCIGVFATILLFALGDKMPAWFTTDEVLQHMIRSAIPLVGLGNITMTFGMLCWSILGAQGRYGLATLISLVTSWGIVIPSASIMTYTLKFNLEGLVASVIIGYTVTAATMTILILQSDWEKASQSIIHMNALTGETYSQSNVDCVSSMESKSSSSSSSSGSFSYDIEMHDIEDDSCTSFSEESTSECSGKEDLKLN